MSFLFVASPPTGLNRSSFVRRSQPSATSAHPRVLSGLPLPEPELQPDGNESLEEGEERPFVNALDVGDAAYNISNFDDINDDTPESSAEGANTGVEEQEAAVANEWFTIAKPISKPDTEGVALPVPSDPDAAPGEGPALDLLALDDASRTVLAKTSYNAIVDVDIDDHGVLPDDDDNGELFSGVGFDALLEHETVLKNLQEGLRIVTATHVQLAAIPRVQEGRDLVMQSHTGTGKTLAFLLPLLDLIDETQQWTQAAIIAPTRELAMQIARECEQLVVDTDIRMLPLIGGANPARQVDKLRRSAPHLVIGTPGRLAELSEARELRASRINTLVIDEADQCLSGEFGEHVHRLLRALPKRVQKVLASATGDVDSVRAFAGDMLHNPVLLRVGDKLRVPRNLSHWVCIVPARLRLDVVRRVLNCEPVPTRTIVFVDEPRRVEFVAEKLWRAGVSVGALRGSAYKTERKEVLDAVRKGKVNVLVTTEVAARGLDVKEMSHVINLDLPTDADHYVHRAGRCGRAGREGTVVNIATGETGFVVKRLARELKVEIKRMEPRGGGYSEVADLERGRREERGRRDERGGAGERGARGRDVGNVESKARRGSVVKKEKGQRVVVRSDAEFGKELDELKQALVTEDEGALMKKLGVVDEDDEDEDSFGVDEGEEEAEVGRNGRTDPVKKRAIVGRKTGGTGTMKKKKLRELAKKDAAKAKRKAAGRKEKRDGNARREVSEEERAASRKAKRLAKRNAGTRAAAEGWVGNRDA